MTLRPWGPNPQLPAQQTGTLPTELTRRQSIKLAVYLTIDIASVIFLATENTFYLSHIILIALYFSDMFALPNKKAMEVVMHFLFTRLHPQLAYEEFRY